MKNQKKELSKFDETLVIIKKLEKLIIEIISLVGWVKILIDVLKS